jgi:hypothetical protein
VILNMHEYKCVNKRWLILKMDYKRQTTVLSVMFLLVGLIFLVSVQTENALASIAARASTTVGDFKFVSSHLGDGKFVLEPTKGPSKIVRWSTEGNGIFGGDEQGYVVYEVSGYGQVTFLFSNPSIGDNTCNIHAPSDLAATCSITQGADAIARYYIEPKGTAPISPQLGAAEPSEDDEGDNSGGS